jgi:putative FmdB family regulatory protein
MPIYEYRCAACGHEIEALQKLSDAPLTVCPSCQKPELKKLLSAAGFQLKGSGWYATDFRNSGAKPAAKDKTAAKSTASADDGGTTSASGSDAGAGAETKSADKPATGTTPESKPAAATPSTPKSDA